MQPWYRSGAGRRRPPFPRLRAGIGPRLLAGVLLFSSAVTLLLTGLQLYGDYRRGVTLLDNRLTEIQRSYGGSLGEGLWNLNRDQLMLQLDGILRLPDIRAVEVRETTTLQNPLVVTAGQRGDHAVMARTVPIVYTVRGAEQPIGALYIEATLTGVYGDLMRSAMVIFIGQAMKTLVVSLFILYLVHRLVTRHLQTLAEFFRSYDFGAPPPPLGLARRAPAQPDEFDAVVAAVNTMSDRLQQAHAELRSANAQLARDIAARQKVEAALQLSQMQLQDYAETASDWFWASDADHRFVYFSEHLGRFGIDPARAIGTQRWDSAADLDEEPEKWRAHRRALDERKPFRDFVFRTEAPPGRTRFVSVSGKPIYDADGRFRGYRGATRDVTARHEAEIRLRELSLAVDQSPAGIAIAAPDGRVIYANPAFQAITGRGAEVVGVTMAEILPEVVWQQLAASAEQGEVGRSEVSARRRAVEVYWATVAVAAIRRAASAKAHFVVTIEDVTRRKVEEHERTRLQTRLEQAVKMEAVGRLAGGIAHDFNNLLGSIIGFAGFLVQDLTPGTNERMYANRILTACEHAKALVSQILAFARVGHVERHPLDLRTVLRDSHDLVRGSLPASTQIDLILCDEPVPVAGNDGELGQILVNLCVNANDAMSGTPGRILVTLGRVRPGDGAYARVNGEHLVRIGASSRLTAGRLAEERDYACIGVADSGAGIDPQVLPRIFEPFFTTKGRRRGVGLGLAAVHGIVMSYDGAYCVETTPGQGAVFSVYLPVAAVRLPAEAPPLTRNPRGQERILIIDDDIDMADMLTIGLERLGYAVVAVNDPDEALHAVIEDPNAWDLVITDQTMPGLTGLALIERLRALRPSLGFILYTGFSDDTTERRARELGAECLLKPIVPQDLAARIRAWFDRDGAS